MLAKARRTIKKLDKHHHDYVRRTTKSGRLTLQLVHRIARASVVQRLDLIRIRLLRLQLNELYKIKGHLEKIISDQREERRLDLEQQGKLELERQRELEQLKEFERERDILARQTDLLMLDSPQPKAQVSAADSTFIRQDTLESQENMPPSVYNTPDDGGLFKESKYSTIDEEERDDLIPDIKTPPKAYPRQSIGQWSVERARNNLSVRSLISSLEDKTGSRPARTSTRNNRLLR